jgi:hypothetical protein
MDLSNRPMIEAGMKKRKRTAPRTLGCLFWAVLVVVLAAVALAVREPVTRNVRRLFGWPSSEQPASSADRGTATPAPARPTPSPTRAPAATPSPAPAVQLSPSPADLAARGQSSTSAPSAGKPPAASASSAGRTRAARLWFVKVDREGAIELAAVSRSLPVGDSPLRDNLAALLAGPSTAERESGVVSLIPAGTALRSVAVKGDTATIDFSEQFRFNALGIEGLRAQLRQVVWAATEFPTVSRVQVLIDGKRVEYLAPEGAAVGSPLARDSDFQ